MFVKDRSRSITITSRSRLESRRSWSTSRFTNNVGTTRDVTGEQGQKSTGTYFTAPRARRFRYGWDHRAGSRGCRRCGRPDAIRPRLPAPIKDEGAEVIAVRNVGPGQGSHSPEKSHGAGRLGVIGQGQGRRGVAVLGQHQGRAAGGWWRRPGGLRSSAGRSSWRPRRRSR